VSDSARMVALGKIVNTHGIRGEVRVLPYNPDTGALHGGARVTLRRPNGVREAALRSVRPNKNVLLVALEGVDSMNAAEELVGYEIEVPEASLPAPAEGQAYHFQLVGLEVVTSDGTPVGVVDEVFTTAANDVCVVRDGEREHLIPYVDAVIESLDLDARRLVIRPLPGLLD